MALGRWRLVPVGERACLGAHEIHEVVLQVGHVSERVRPVSVVERLDDRLQLAAPRVALIRVGVRELALPEAHKDGDASLENLLARAADPYLEQPGPHELQLGAGAQVVVLECLVVLHREHVLHVGKPWAGRSKRAVARRTPLGGFQKKQIRRQEASWGHVAWDGAAGAGRRTQKGPDNRGSPRQPQRSRVTKITPRDATRVIVVCFF